MLLNIVLTVVAALCQVSNSWMGYKVTGSTVTRRHRTMYDVAFIVVGLVGVLCVGFVEYRGNQAERAHFAYTVTPASGLAVNQPLALNVEFTNTGSGSAYNFLVAKHAYIELDECETSQKPPLLHSEKRLRFMSIQKEEAL